MAARGQRQTDQPGVGVCGQRRDSCVRRRNLPACSGCHGAPCGSCALAVCAAGKGAALCLQCADYPCQLVQELHESQPQCQDLWRDLARIHAAGAVGLYAEVLKEMAGEPVSACAGCAGHTRHNPATRAGAKKSK
jgi:hypothetical protein